MVSKEKRQILFSSESTGGIPENLFASTMARYELTTDDRSPLSLNEASQLIAEKTSRDLNEVKRRLLKLTRSLNLKDNFIPPDIFMFELDYRTDKDDLLKRFGWAGFDKSGISLLQACSVLSAITETNSSILSQQIETEIIKTYPTIKKWLQNRQRATIPSRFFLNRFDKALPEEERIRVEKAIQKFKLTPTEYSILLLIAQAKTNQEISRITNTSIGTIKNQINDIFSKLSKYEIGEVFDRTQATIIALREGMLPPSLTTMLPEIKLASNIQYLTPREIEILNLIAEGFSNKEIALELIISFDTVKNHLTSIYKKLGCESNRTSAAIIYLLALRER
jgi:DNA-binding NarL/FixJ family response regulator